jgi:hypothetical protein
MLKFEWNALRTGDKVLMHDRASASPVLVAGVVAMVDAQKGANGVGIRVDAGGGKTTVQWPSHLAVHRDPVTEPCWECERRKARKSV